jgi:anaerobic C4-dicarboxylate transporter
VFCFVDNCAILSSAFDNAGPARMKHVFLSMSTAVLIVAMTLSAMVILVRATQYVTAIESPLQRAGAIAAEILLGVVLLLGTVWLATHLAVLIFAPKSHSPDGGGLG